MLKKSGIDVYIDTGNMNEGLLRDEQKLAIYRIAQEQWTNINKYAESVGKGFTLGIMIPI